MTGEQDDDDFALFRRAMGGVQPLRRKGQSVTRATGNETGRAKQDRAQVPEATQARAHLSRHSLGSGSTGQHHLRHDRPVAPSDPDSLDPLQGYRRPGQQRRTTRQLRDRRFQAQAEIDLHGLTREEALAGLARFMVNCQQRGLTHVLIIHGKGHHSIGGEGVLRGVVAAWLRQQHTVLASRPAGHGDGGSGATRVIIKA